MSAISAIFTVTTAGDPGSGGLSLRDAVIAANASSNNVVQFDPGLVGSTITLASGEIAVSAPMSIQGPGAGKLAISGDSASRVFNITNGGIAPMLVTISGLTLTAGHTDDPDGGGGVRAQNVSLTLQDVVISASTASRGSAIYSVSTQATSTLFSKVGILNNTSTVGLGALRLKGSGTSTVTIDNSIVSGNHAGYCCGAGSVFGHLKVAIDATSISANSAAGEIGGLDVSGNGVQRMYLTNSTVSDNVANAGPAGGLFLHSLWTTIDNCRISGNYAQGGAGGGISVYDGGVASSRLSIFRTTISGNSATNFGGGIDVQNGYSLEIHESLISGNSVLAPSGGGGGISLRAVSNITQIEDSTVYGNYAYHGGGGIGIFDATTGSHTYIRRSTIAGNSTYDDSNGILGSGTPTLNSCVVANNAGHASNQDLAGTFSASYSLFRTPGSALILGSGNLAAGTDPKLGPLAVNGGPTASLLPTLGSPLEDHADPAISPLLKDQRLLPRVANGRADIGAVERQYPEDVIFRNGFDSS